MIETTLYTLLSTSPAITSIISTRVYPVLVPTAATLPALDYKIISTTPSQTFLTTGTQRYRIEINCWATTYSDAVTLRQAVNATLDGYFDGHTSIRLLSTMDDFNQDLLQYRAITEFYIFST